MANLMFFMIVYVLAATLLLLCGGMEITKYENQNNYRRKKIGAVCFSVGALLFTIMAFPVIGMGGIVMSLGAFLLVPIFEYERIIWELSYKEKEKIKKAKQAKILMYVLLAVVELIGVRLMIGAALKAVL
ncbi:MAG: hypothetical protein J6A62_04140 [Oscillospiraceae bacterium]|nr:hypothetical protein [Oscillospiraceae bacterium]